MERRREAVRVAAEQRWSEAAMERWSTGAAAAVADQRRRWCGGSEQRQRWYADAVARSGASCRSDLRVHSPSLGSDLRLTARSGR
ncbi:hypothetical protein U1Q18_009056 [Sarracenia purpurea var. burkii]